MVFGVRAISNIASSFLTSSVQPISSETKAKLEKLGIDTSNIRTEAQGQEALKSANIDNENKASTLMKDKHPPQGQPPAWISLMQQNGMSPTGSIDGDKAVVSATLASMDPDKAISLALQFQAAGLSVDAPNQQQTDTFVGQNQLAEMNKHFLLKKCLLPT
ncbi:MAG: hypothetical protein V2B14_01360 [bacterium]